ncbi:uncharacterized protein N7487_000248 [Penicillium crustosum]|uniref:uncharacterized protein n=1 Tax=Penicillium crustosum TaxID=36656 RepID=UPI00238615D6|nr:uncharacterized protein N7487_000248 [Penicillium crustosum]KAJ5416698.1 hypothetical protein N7487_000248 [Penicillium crustosum]
MAPQAFCCDQIRSLIFENEYRLGIFICWAKAGNKRPPTKDETPELNVPFCVQVFQKPKSLRLFLPTVWGKFTEINRKLLATPWVSYGVHRKAYQATVYERRANSLTLSPRTPTSSNTKVLDKNDYGDPSSSTAIKEPTYIAGEPYASTNPPAANDHTETLVGMDTKCNSENISSLANMPAAEILKTYLFHDLRKLTESVEENIFLWMLLSASYPAVKFLMGCSPSNVYTKEERAKILEATAAAVNAVYCLAIGQHESQDSNPDFIDVFKEICRQHPDDGYLTSLVNRTIERLRQVIEAEEEEQNKAGLPVRDVHSLANEDDTYDHRDLSISDQEAE